MGFVEGIVRLIVVISFPAPRMILLSWLGVVKFTNGTAPPDPILNVSADKFRTCPAKKSSTSLCSNPACKSMDRKEW